MKQNKFILEFFNILEEDLDLNKYKRSVSIKESGKEESWMYHSEHNQILEELKQLLAKEINIINKQEIEKMRLWRIYTRV